MNNRSSLIVTDYVRESVSAYHSLLKLCKCDNPNEARSLGLIPKNGFLDTNSQVNYNFHGIGCEVRGDYIIDFNFTQFVDSKFIFNVFIIYTFINANLEKYQFDGSITAAEVKSDLYELEKTGMILIYHRNKEYFFLPIDQMENDTRLELKKISQSKNRWLSSQK